MRSRAASCRCRRRFCSGKRGHANAKYPQHYTHAHTRYNAHMTWTKTLLYWFPRILGVACVLFLSLFALDVFSEYTGWSIVLPLLIHLAPALLLLVAVAIAWKYDLFGTYVFFGFALWYVWSAGLDRPWSWYAFIAGPAALVGALFLAHWLYARRERQNATANDAQTALH